MCHDRQKYDKVIKEWMVSIESAAQTVKGGFSFAKTCNENVIE